MRKGLVTHRWVRVATLFILIRGHGTANVFIKECVNKKCLVYHSDVFSCLHENVVILQRSEFKQLLWLGWSNK